MNKLYLKLFLSALISLPFNSLEKNVLANDVNKRIVDFYLIEKGEKPLELIKEVLIKDIKKCGEKNFISQKVLEVLTDGSLSNYEAVSFGLTFDQKLVCKMRDLEGAVSYRYRALTDSGKDSFISCF